MASMRIQATGAANAAIDIDDIYDGLLLTERAARHIGGIATGIRATVEPFRKLLPLTESAVAPSDDALHVLEMVDAIQQIAIDIRLRAAKHTKLLGKALDARVASSPDND